MPIIKIIKNIVIAMISLCLIVGCGFHLRNVTALPTQLHTIYLQTDNPYGDFTIIFKRVLKTSNIVLVTSPDLAPYTLHLTSTYAYTATASATSNQARIYSLIYSASIYLSDKNGKTVLPLRAVSATRSVTLAPNEVFEVSNQVLIVKQELQQELANKLFNILSSRQTFLTFSKDIKT